MAIEIRVPTLGESITEATVGKWFKKAGDPVQADEPLVELETDKVTLEVNAPSPGVLSEIVAETGQTVAIGALLGQVAAGAAAPTAAAKSAPTPVTQAPAAAKGAPAATTAMPPAPAAAKIAAEDKIDLASIAGSGKRGQVLKGDVLAAAAAAQAPAPSVVPAPLQTPVSPPAPAPAARTTTPDDGAREERVRMTKLRQTIARRLKDAQNTAAMLTTFNEVDMSEVMALRARYKDAFEKKHAAKLGFMGFFVKACVQALKELPAVNAELDGADLVY
ncbi:MAG TPA: 2-oxo acid dehydrogenase subunit E2, partial [Roseiarcus sp.]